MQRRIHDSARKHGIRDEDIHHAIDVALVVARLDDQRLLHLGPDRAGNMLEVIEIAAVEGDHQLVIHAMRMRRTYRRRLRGLGDPDG
jgi:hypothetical protein